MIAATTASPATAQAGLVNVQKRSFTTGDFRLESGVVMPAITIAYETYGRMAPDGTMLGEYDIPTAGSGARCMTAMSNGRLYFTQWDAGLIGAVIPR